MSGYAIVENGIVVNRIVAGDEETAAALGAVPDYDGCAIGQPYAPPRVYTETERTQQEITDLQLSDIEQGQAVTDLELLILEVRNV